MARLDEYERKRAPERTPEPFGGAVPQAEGADLRRPAPRRAPAPLRLPPGARRRARELGRAEGRPARARRAPPRGARRGPPARVRDLRGRDPEGPVRRRHRRDLGHGHVRARRGEARRRPDRPALRASGSTASGRSSRPSSTAIRRTGCSSRSATRRRSKRGKPAEYAPMLATLSRGAPERPRLALRGQVGRLPGARHRARRRGRADEPARELADRALRDGREGAPGRAANAALRPRRRGLRARRRTAGRASPRCSRASGTLVFYVFDVLEIDGEPLIDLSFAERRRRLEGILEPGAHRRPPLGDLRRRRGAPRR